ncbi:MBL fold metallo-hydrolase [Cellulomonas sp. HZM]|uniref:MBL fold metallo-hydrolase n=1 Tax=Cellulomonas sp. HZM TaxID=1454010 RepID=UPI000B2FD6A9|nr:MBL fold metallo-hydrolase [Cellulomonas sp. HZM]
MTATLVEVAPGVLVATSTVMSTTSTVVAAAGRALLVDPAWLPHELAAIADDLDARGLRAVGGFATHAHHDHLLWHPRFGDALRWASPATARLAREHRVELVDRLGPLPEELSALVARVEPVVDAIPRTSLPRGIEVELVVHDGHAPGHTALWVPGPDVLVAGDMLRDVEIPLPFDPDDVPAYLEGLDRLAPFVARAHVVVPGHGTPGDPRPRLEADRRYLDAVLRGREPDDERLRDPAMRVEHERLRRVVADQPT